LKDFLLANAPWEKTFLLSPSFELYST
jgi:hypothetical protein